MLGQSLCFVREEIARDPGVRGQNRERVTAERGRDTRADGPRAEYREIAICQRPAQCEVRKAARGKAVTSKTRGEPRSRPIGPGLEASDLARLQATKRGHHRSRGAEGRNDGFARNPEPTGRASDRFSGVLELRAQDGQRVVAGLQACGRKPPGAAIDRGAAQERSGCTNTRWAGLDQEQRVCNRDTAARGATVFVDRTEQSRHRVAGQRGSILPQGWVTGRRFGSRATLDYVPGVHVDAFDATSIATLRALLLRLDPEGVPELVPLVPARRATSVCLIPGSFNPPTSAHVALAEHARGSGFDGVWFLYARRTLAKRANGLTPEDRLLAMRLASPDGVGTAVVSHGLLVDQAEAAARAFDAKELSFVVGSDKLEQLFESQWYPNRDEALERFFARARLIVVPRHGEGEKTKVILQRTEARPFAHRVDIVHLHPSVSEVSSTRVRQVLRAGGSPAGLVPPHIEEFLVAVGVFSPPTVIAHRPVNRYDLRQRLIDLVLDSRCTREAPDLHALWRLALDPGSGGETLRDLLGASVTLDASVRGA